MKNVGQLLLGLISGIGTTVLVLAAASLALLEGGASTVAFVPPTETPVSITPNPLPPLIVVTITQSITQSITLSSTPTLTPTDENYCDEIPDDWLPYTVQEGDTIESLVAKSGVSTQEFLTANCFKIESLTLKPGWVVYLPPTAPTATATLTPTPVPPTPTLCGAPAGWVNYIVQPGDTLFRLSLILGISQAQLQSANCLPSTTIYAGRILRVPFLPPVNTRTPTQTITPTKTDTPVTPTWTITPTSDTPTPITPVPVKQDQTITFAPLADKTYGDAPFTVSASTSSGLPVTFTAVGSCSIAVNTVTITGAGSCTITASQAGDSTYNAAQPVSQTFQISRANQTISFAPLPNRTVSESPITVSATASSGLPVSFSASGNCAIAGNTVTLNGAGSCSITASQTGDSYYDAADPVTQTFQIWLASQTISFAPLPDRAVSESPITVSATASSGLPVSFSASGNCAIAGNTVTLNGAGSCSITASQTGDSYYDAADPVTQTFQIWLASQTISFAPLPDRTVSESPITISATASSGLPVSFSASGNCTIAGNTVTLNGVGNCSITASQTGDSYYDAAAPVTQTFLIN